MKYKKYLENVKGKEPWPMIVVDGVVGVGKTTLMNILVEEFGYTAFLEPVVDNPILDKFYYDRKRYSFPLQIFFLNNRFKAIKEASLVNKAVLDRSIYGDLIFAKLLMENDEMDEAEYNIYIDLFKNMVEHLSPPKLMIYLETGVDEAIKKINKRGREYEKVVEKDYWLKLNQHYTEYFKDYDISPLLKINVDSLDFENNIKDREYVLGLIKDAINKVDK